MSTAEGELLAGCACFQLYLSVDSVLKELGIDLRGVLGVDNTAAEAIFKNSPANWRTRHLRIRASAVSDSDLDVLHCPGVDMIADVGTKAVSEKVLRHVLALMNVKTLATFALDKDGFQTSPSVSKMIATASNADWPLDDDYVVEATGLVETMMNEYFGENDASASTATSSGGAGVPAPVLGKFCGVQTCYHCARPKWKRKCLGPGGTKAVADEEYAKNKRAKSKAIIAQEFPSDSTALATMLVGALGVGISVGSCATTTLKTWLHERVQKKAGAIPDEQPADAAEQPFGTSSAVDVAVQTDIVSHAALDSIWVSEWGEKFHRTPECKGLRSANMRISKTRCKMCG
ncbi:unnamed protein product [Polarella glacialis]|uniref:Uncharacterized protein n=1 Tax=Polarella glacialis TaxID=89957 RepID=A0A813DCM5_POLGL|nr:unnamed protein product [Polarella glacialis]